MLLKRIYRKHKAKCQSKICEALYPNTWNELTCEEKNFPGTFYVYLHHTELPCWRVILFNIILGFPKIYFYMVHLFTEYYLKVAMDKNKYIQSIGNITVVYLNSNLDEIILPSPPLSYTKTIRLIINESPLTIHQWFGCVFFYYSYSKRHLDSPGLSER